MARCESEAKDNKPTADLSGVGREWWQNAALLATWNETQSILAKAGGAIPPADREHVKLNWPVLRPILERMKDQHYIHTPYLPQIEKEVWVYHALRDTAGRLDLDNPPKHLSADETSRHIDATAIKKLVAFVRRHYLRPHTPQDWKQSLFACKCWRATSTYQTGENVLVVGVPFFICRNYIIYSTLLGR